MEQFDVVYRGFIAAFTLCEHSGKEYYETRFHCPIRLNDHTMHGTGLFVAGWGWTAEAAWSQFCSIVDSKLAEDAKRTT